MAESPAPNSPVRLQHKEKSFHLARLKSEEATVEQKIMAAQACFGIPFTEEELNQIFAGFLQEKNPYLRGVLVKILTHQGTSRREIQNLVGSICTSDRKEDAAPIPSISDAIWHKILGGNAGDPSLIELLREYLPALRHQEEAVARSVLLTLDQWVEDYDKRSAHGPEGDAYRETLRGEPLKNDLQNFSLRHESGWVRYEAAKVLHLLGQEVPEEWKEVIASEAEDETSEDETEEEGFAKVWEWLSAINKQVPFETSLTEEGIAALDEQIREAPSPLQLLQEYFDEGAKVVFLEYQHVRGESFSHVAKEVCKLHEEAGLTHFALGFDPELYGLFHRFLNGDVSEDLRPFFDELQPDCLQPNIPIVDAVIRYRKALRAIRESGVKIVFYAARTGVHPKGENAFDQQVRVLLTPVREGGKVLVYHDELEHFCGARTPLTDYKGELKLSLAPALLREFDNDERAVISLLQDTNDDLASKSLTLKIHNLDHFFNRSSFSRDVGLKLEKSPLKNLRFRQGIRDCFGSAWHAAIIRASDDDENREIEEIPELPKPEALEPILSPSFSTT